MKWAYFGRVSDKDKQDPSLSIPRQLKKCAEALPIGDQITSHYWDIESGRKSIEERGNGADGTLYGISVPRDGGVTELLADARQGHFDAVMVESIDRLSRMTADSTRVEQELERLGIGLFASDEPMTADATAILTRRVKQGVAEWYVRDLIEKSRRGMEESVRQGWHTGGRAPYGYMLEAHPHPNPNKAREGKRKHRLILDPVRAPVVLMIFEDYCMRLLGIGAICEKLNRDLDRFPAPIPNRKDENGLAPTWSRSVIHALLRNPKYTGYNVWGRNDKRPGRPQIRPREEWIGAPSRPTTRSSRESFSRWLRSARSPTTRARRPGPASTPGLPRRARGDCIRSAVACAAACVDTAWRAPTKRAPTGIAASTSNGAARQPPSTPITPKSSASRRPRCWTRSSTSLLVACSAQTGSASSKTNSPKQPPRPGIGTRPSVSDWTASWPESTARYARKHSAWRSTKTRGTQSSRSQPSGSKNSVRARAPSQTQSTTST